ncbi:MAG: fibronectin type III domain-containing protein [Syntrophomonadaceae bacterium]|nr:fibronectin type III domain-containing protein [Syntrophomonadaceae bacterium]
MYIKRIFRKKTKILKIALVIFVTISYVTFSVNEAQALVTHNYKVTPAVQLKGGYGDGTHYQASTDEGKSHTMIIEEGDNHIAVIFPNGASGIISRYRELSWRAGKYEINRSWRAYDKDYVGPSNAKWSLYNSNWELVKNGEPFTYNRTTREYEYKGIEASGLPSNSLYYLAMDVAPGPRYSGGYYGFICANMLDYVEGLRPVTGDTQFVLEMSPMPPFLIRTLTITEFWTTDRYIQYMPLYTEAKQPILSAADIKDTRITLNWISNGNPETTTYILQRKLGGGAWVDRYTGPLLTFTDTGLADETLYDYRVIAKHISGDAARDKVSEIIKVTTTANPAVAAAQEAASKAQAAKEAAEQTLQYSSDAKIAAENAQKTAETVLNQVNHSKYGLEALYNKIDLSILPDIRKVSNPKGATVAVNQKFDVKINATGIKENLRYRVICGEFDSGWQESNIITITKLYESGVKTATILVSNNPIEPDKGAIAEDEFKFFCL